MAFEFFEVDSSALATSKHCRLDQKYTSFTQVKDWKVFETDLKQLKLSNFLEELPIKKYTKGELEDGFYLVNISDQQQRYGELENVEIVDEIGSDKNCLSGADIIISKLGMPKGYIFLNTFKDKDVLGSTEFIPYKIRDQKFAIYLKYILLHPKSLKAYEALESGKTPSHKRVNPYEFLKIQIPLPTNPNQIVAQIEPIECKIKDLRSQIKKPQEIINKVFAREFGFDENLYNEFGKGMTAGTQIADNRTLRVFETDFAGLARSEIFRFSTRYHNPPTKKLMEILDGIETVKVVNVLSETIHRGASPKYDENGSIPVVKTGHLKNGYIEISQDEFVDESFHKSSARSQVKSGDVLIASTGKVSLGKIDLVETDEDLVADGHLSILRIDEKKYNRLFLVYFFRCVFGYFQIERDFTGATNQIELYANEIGNFLIPNLPLSHQQKIVDEIKLELDSQELIKKQIESERQKIDATIERAISLRG